MQTFPRQPHIPRKSWWDFWPIYLNKSRTMQSAQCRGVNPESVAAAKEIQPI
jgi:hypothetical protein